MAAYPPYPTPSTWTWSTLYGGAHAGRNCSAALTADDRVIYVYCQGGDASAGGGHDYYGGQIRQVYYPTKEDFYAANNTSAHSDTLLFGTGGKVDSASNCDPSATVFTHPDGTLYLLAQTRKYTGNGNNGQNICRVYRSPSGIGESSPGNPDWVLHGTVFSTTGVNGFGPEGFKTSNEQSCIGLPFITGSGRWVLAGPTSYNWDSRRFCVRTSDNNGVSWTQRVEIGYYYAVGLVAGLYGYGYSRNIVQYNGRLYWLTGGNPDFDRGAYSSDDGTTWTIHEYLDRYTTGSSDCYIGSDSDGVYIFHMGGSYDSSSGPGRPTPRFFHPLGYPETQMEGNNLGTPTSNGYMRYGFIQCSIGRDTVLLGHGKIMNPVGTYPNRVVYPFDDPTLDRISVMPTDADFFERYP